MAIIQARMGSRRLPGKVLLPCLGKPILAYQIERLRTVNQIDQIVIATTTNEPDDSIVNFCQQNDLAFFRGSEHDVLSRYAEAAEAYNADIIVRLTADCPLIDPQGIDQVISTFIRLSCSRVYVSNTIERTYPRGMDAEVFSIELLQWAHKNAVSPYDREHVTPLMIRNEREDIIHKNVCNTRNLSAYRFTLDNPLDYVQISLLIESDLPNYSMQTLLNRAADLKINFYRRFL